MIKAILFDLDGTLINTNELIVESFNYAFKKHNNINIDREEIVATFGEPLGDTMARYDSEHSEILVKLFRSYNESKHDELATTFEGIEEGLKALKAINVKLGVVTSKRKIMAERGLKLIGIYDYMDVIVTPEDTDRHKPLGDPAEKACELLGIEPREAIMVGDSHNDILCGKSAGCSTCLVTYTALDMDSLLKHKPDYVIDKIEELVGICKNLEEKVC